MCIYHPKTFPFLITFSALLFKYIFIEHRSCLFSRHPNIEPFQVWLTRFMGPESMSDTFMYHNLAQSEFQTRLATYYWSLHWLKWKWMFQKLKTALSEIWGPKRTREFLDRLQVHGFVCCTIMIYQGSIQNRFYRTDNTAAFKTIFTSYTWTWLEF